MRLNIEKIRDLDIAKNPFDYSKDIINGLDYEKWKEYIANHLDYFSWIEDTAKGKDSLANIDKIPEWAKERLIISHNKRNCCAEFCAKKNYYDINVSFHKELKRIKVSFERKLNVDDLKRFLDMANYLDAYLLKDGTEIIDEKVIENLE